MGEPYTLITGATSDIGRNIARVLAPSTRILLAGRNENLLQSVRTSCSNPETHQLWVKDLAQATNVGDELTCLLGSSGVSIAHFVHCAALFARGEIQDFDPPSICQLFTVNLFSAVEIIRVLASRRANGGMLRTITFLSSIATRIGIRGGSVYAASKGAMNALARSLAVELAPTVRVNSVLPGTLNPERAKQSIPKPDALSEVEDCYPLGFGNAEAIADVVAFVTSDKARWITGQEIVVDGGRSVV